MSVARLTMNDLENLISAFQDVPRPLDVSGDEMGLEASKEQIERLLNLDPKSATAHDFLGYVGYVCSTTGGIDDFRFLLPALLCVWKNEILCEHDGWFLQHFHGNVADLDFFEAELTPLQKAAVFCFMRSTLMKRIGDETSLQIAEKTRTHDWFGNFACFGVVSLELPTLWRELWAIPTAGHARAVLQYASVIICDDDANIIFSPHTPNFGGGAPTLWEYNSLNRRACWKPQNARFLRATLSADYLSGAIVTARARLSAKEQEVADQLLEELQTGQVGRTEARCAAVCTALETPDLRVMTKWYDLGAW